MWNNSSVECLETSKAQILTLSSYIAQILLTLPLSVYTLAFGFQQWRKQKSTSHSDYFTFHSISSQLIGTLAMMAYFLGNIYGNDVVFMLGYNLNTVTYVTVMLIHCFSCVERYLAVIHPLTYLKLKHSNGIVLRNAAVAGGWLLGFCHGALVQVIYPIFPVTLFSCLLGVILGIISFCSVSVLRVLNLPGPSDNEKVDQTKRRAFKTIVAIMGVLVFWLTGMLICIVLQQSTMAEEMKCLVYVSILTFNIPSHLVLPLLYLKRNAKLPCYKKQ